MTQRTLTDDDVQAIVDALEDRITQNLYLSAGRGIWDLAKKGFFLAVLGLAAYGAGKGMKLW
jgi:hypothetical protein